MCRYTVVEVTWQALAISAIVNRRELYMRWAVPTSSGIIFGLRPPTPTSASTSTYR